jgi:cell division protein ZapE
VTGPLSLYRQRIASGAIKPDPEQEKVVLALQRLHDRLTAAALHKPQSPGGLWGLFSRRSEAPQPAPRGLYLHGSVGRGKSMLMDLFVETSPEPKTRRVHFHAFMLEVQQRLHALRQERGGEEDPLGRLAQAIAAETRLLCFDEFHVVNIADAMILGRLFSGLFDHGVTAIATSNWAPDRLYWNGLNRDRFLPFIELLKSRVDVVTLDGPVDYRVERLRDARTWFAPIDQAATEAAEKLFRALTDGAQGAPTELPVGSRTLVVPRADGPIAWFDFPELCARALGAADYLAIGTRFRVVFLTRVPILAPGRRNEARRFMTLVDALYECRRVLVVTAEGSPADLYSVGEGAFEFQRTVSRLMEMQSSEWLAVARQASGDDTPTSFAPFALTSDLS